MPVRPAYHRYRSVLLTFALGLWLFPAACVQTDGPRSRAPATGQHAVGDTDDGGSIPHRPVFGIEPPADLVRGLLDPLRGEALRTARMPIENVLAQLNWPESLPRPEQLVMPQPYVVRQEPPLTTQRRYIRARVAQGERQYAAAVRHLQAARDEQPNEPRLAQTLGQFYFDIGRRIQGQRFLAAALEAGSIDAYSLVLLGMQAMHDQDDDTAAAYMYIALAVSKESDPVLAVIARYHLGVALMRKGYLAAGREQLEDFVTYGVRVQRTTRYAREMYVLTQQEFPTLVQMGDASHRLGEPEAALRFYQEADRVADAQRLALLPRLVYTLLCTGHDEQARQTVLEVLRPTVHTRVLGLLDYLVANDPVPGRLADVLMRLYRQQDRPSALAERIARLYTDAAGVRFLAGHLQYRPDDREVFAAVMHRVGQAGSRRLALFAWTSAVEALDAVPAALEVYGDVVASDRRAAKVLTAAWRRLPGELQQREGATYLQARMLVSMNRLDDAAALLVPALAGGTGGTSSPLEALEVLETREAMQATDALRVLAADVAVRRGHLEQAAALLDALASRETMPRAQALWAHVLRLRGEPEAAVKVFERLLVDHPGQVAWAMEAADLQRALGRSREAAGTLGRAVAKQPEAVALYEALFELYTSTDAPGDAGRQLRALTQLARTHIPDARITVYRSAIELAAGGQWEKAERLCRDLLLRDPYDAEALELLVHALVVTDQSEAADQLVSGRLSRGLEDPATQEAAARLAIAAMADGRWDDATAWSGRLGDVSRLTEPATYFNLKGRLLVRRGKIVAAEKLAARLGKQYPEQAADLAYEWAMLLGRIGRERASEQALVAAIERFPNHANMANALGYTWADRGERLDEAHTLIERALKSDPENAAYLDSMGWVLYKQGDFRAAVEYLRAAVAQPGGDHPVLITHWADAIYRLDDVVRATALWEAAQRRLSERLSRRDGDTEGPADEAGGDLHGELDSDVDPETRALPQALRARLEAVAQGRPAPVAPVAPVAVVGEEGPTVGRDASHPGRP